MTEAIDENFLSTVQSFPAVPPADPAAEVAPGLTGARLLELFDAQLGSRHLDLAARELGKAGQGFYSIGSSGHEGNVAVAAALRPTDPALLHYRSGGFYLERARQVPGQQPLRDVLLGVTASVHEPISGGRHKVFGNAALGVIPQTSTIASHLPRAVGVAFGIERAKKLNVSGPWPADAVVVCSFGDASANHSTATGAINSAVHCAYQGLPMPLLFVCEDNGIGISVRTPRGWIEHAYAHRPGLRWFDVDGTDLPAALAVSAEAAAWVRANRAPAFLRLRTVRLMGHAGSDVESAYRGAADIAADQARDPVLCTAKLLVTQGILSPNEVIGRYEHKRAEVAAIAREAVLGPRLASAAEVTAPLAQPDPGRVAAKAAEAAGTDARARAFDRLPEQEEGLTFAQAVNRALADVLARDKGALVFGEDVAVKGGVYGVTRGLRKKFGAARVFDTLLDEQSVLGTALGTALCGFLPIPEIQYLAYLHNAADQLRGEAATLRFFANGQYRNPMVVRIAGYAYQKGFGGHFHNDNSVAALRDIPGLVIASPSRPDDAAAMLRTCAAAARANGSVCVFLEPIALYHTRDLHTPGDNGWLRRYPEPERWGETHVPVGRARTHGDGTDLTIVTFANGVPMSLRVASRLAERGIGARVLDLRWLAPLPVEDLLREASATGRVLVADETRTDGGVSEAVVTALADGGFTGPVRRVTSVNSFIPLGSAANHVLLSENDIEKAAVELAG
ncbi:thiamine pyrophosphate-dependent enzyme [Amycolatopsis taiwanensis]|uniref:MFS transporter n=1 Tax=Amycolatopsis taiwanensis TaxID=342230 RepID=A0A9W6VE61_9PSEU|nr:thiamine pyrophosphate-dependent enzyme [Amycolatopsis taiwanensis]GLY68108.1 MFS transporter [Amycolatopsis taiwanensis]